MRWLWHSSWLWLAVVATAFAAPIFAGLDRTDLDNDESIYSFGVEVMLKDGDWLTPKSIPSETRPFHEKPPLKFWITALPMWLGWLPSGEFGLRFMDAAMAGLALMYVFLIGRRLGGPVAGLAAVFLLFIDRHLIFEHGLRSNNMESALLLSYCGGIYHFLAWRSVNPDMKRHVYSMALYFVLGFMTKFVAAMFLPVILSIAVFLRHEDRARLYRDWTTFALAALLAIALIVPWFVYAYFLPGSHVFDVMFGVHIMKRFTASLDPSHLHPWHHYVTTYWENLSWWTVRIAVLAGVLLLTARAVRHRSTESALILLWFAVPVGAISTGTSKLYHYVYPFLPALALAAGCAIALAARGAFAALQRPFAAVERLRAPAVVLRGGIVALALFLVLPVYEYQPTLERTAATRRPWQEVRQCLTPLAEARAAEGRGMPGVWVDSGDLGHLPFYYLRGVGPWGRGPRSVDEAVVKYVTVAESHRPVMVSHERYSQLRPLLEAPVEDRSASVIGVVTLPDSILLLPGPFRTCATETLRVHNN